MMIFIVLDPNTACSCEFNVWHTFFFILHQYFGHFLNDIFEWKRFRVKKENVCFDILFYDNTIKKNTYRRFIIIFSLADNTLTYIKEFILQK